MFGAKKMKRKEESFMAKGHGGGSSHSGKGSGSKPSTPMSKEAASRIQSAGDRNPGGKTAQSGFTERAQSTADKRER